MQNPCQDSYYTLFSSYTMLLDYHEEQAKNSRWIRCKVADLQVEPLGESSPLIGNLSAFAAGTSQEAVKDTAENLGLAMRVNGELYPVRMTAYKSLLDRAKIGGTALPKLSREVLAEVLNECLKLYSADALLLIRDEKISAVHSGDEVDYSVLPIDELLKVLQAKLDARFSGNEFESGYCDHSLVSASWRMPDQKEDLLGTYAKVLAAQGKATMASKLMPGIRFMTSDTGVASAKVSALLMNGRHSIHIGGCIPPLPAAKKMSSLSASVVLCVWRSRKPTQKNAAPVWQNACRPLCNERSTEMATILEQYRKRQNDIREQIAANSLPLDQVLIMQELNYRICVLETFESLCKSAPVTMDTKSMGFHFQLVDAYVRFTLNERKFGPKTDAEGQKKRETALQSFTQVVQDGRKRFSSFNASTQEQYKTCIRKAEDRLAAVEADIDRYRKLKISAYEDMCDGILSKEDYLDIKEQYEMRISEAQLAEEQIRHEIDLYIENGNAPQRWIQEFLDHRNIQSLTRIVAVEFPAFEGGTRAGCRI